MKRLLPLTLSAVLFLAFSACDSADPSLAAASASPQAAGEISALSSRWAGPDTPALAEVAVMTQNLYLGGNLFQLLDPSCALTPQNPVPFLVCVDRLYGQIVASDFETRAEAIADEIARVRPALVGLQEVSTYYVQSPGDNLPGGANTPATEVTIDFLDILLDALAERGLTYAAVSVSQNSDVELPALGATGIYDVRYQDADVVLALNDPDVSVGATAEYRFGTLFSINVGGTEQTFIRGYQTVEATVDGLSFTFVNTHLEVGQQAAVQEAQAAELAAALARISGPLVLVGDLNSPADGSGTRTYAMIKGLLSDVYDRPNLRAMPTCCQASNLLNPVSRLDQRIDFVLYRGFDRVQKAETVLDEVSDRILSGGRLLWPSDHAGVAALLIYNLRRARPHA